jgi:DNA-binding beta-propeller fold protein YncE
MVRRIAINPAGTRVVVTTHDDDSGPSAPSSVHFVDVTTMTEIDTDTDAPGIQGVTLTGLARPQDAAFSPDGQTVYLAGVSSPGAAFIAIDAQTFAVTPIDIGSGTSDLKSMSWGPGGVLYIAADPLGDGPLVYSYDGQSAAAVPNYTGDRARGVGVLPDGNLLVTTNSQGIDIVNPLDGSVVRTLGSGQTFRNHTLTVTR